MRASPAGILFAPNLEGQPGRVVVKEKDYLNLPTGAASGGLEDERGDPEMLWAGYGTGDRRREVTDLVWLRRYGEINWTCGFQTGLWVAIQRQVCQKP
jgi:hypothetical protein